MIGDLAVVEVVLALLVFAIAVTGAVWGGEWLTGWRATRAALAARHRADTPPDPAPDPEPVGVEDTRPEPITPVTVVHPVMPPPVPAPAALPRHRLADAATGSFSATAVLARLTAEGKTAPPITRATRRPTADAP